MVRSLPVKPVQPTTTASTNLERDPVLPSTTYQKPSATDTTLPAPKTSAQLQLREAHLQPQFVQPSLSHASLASTSPQRPQHLVRNRSFLETLVARQQNKKRPRISGSNSTRLVHPINHIPRPVPIRIPPLQSQHDEAVEGASLLTLPEQRRSRQNSPITPTVEHSPSLLSDPARQPSNIGLPRNQKRLLDSYLAPMPRLDRLAIRGGQTTSHRHQNSDQDVEANRRTPLATPQTPTFPGATYGFEPSDQPAVPPRRVSSIHSFKNNNRSATSLHTSPHAPPPLPASYNSSTNPSYYQQDPSHPSQTASAQQGGTGTYVEDGDDMAEELSWGPAHPCFPHLNPHVPINSPEYASTRIIRIRRDWMIAGDLAPTYSNVYPEILDPLLPETQFRYIIEHVNATLLKAYDPFDTWNWIDGLLGLATGWFWEDFRRGGVKGQLRDLEKWMEEWNERVGWKDGVRLIPLRRTGYMDLDIEIPDPQVRVVTEDEEGQDYYDVDGTEAEAGADAVTGTSAYQHQQLDSHQRDHIPIPGPSQAGDFGHITTQPSTSRR